MAIASVVEISTLTSKGQITLPKIIRQLLRLEEGSEVRFRVAGNAVTLDAAPTGKERDPAIDALLAMFEKDIVNGRGIGKLPVSLQRSMKKAARQAKKLNEPIEGEVDL